jgi:hypothetical protein
LSPRLSPLFQAYSGVGNASYPTLFTDQMGMIGIRLLAWWYDGHAVTEFAGSDLWCDRRM